MSEPLINYCINPPVTNDELNALFADAWKSHEITDFPPILERSLAYLCAYSSNRLIGFVNLAWDGGIHAFVLDTTVHPDFQRCGIGKSLITKAIETARKYNIKWLHVDFEPHLQSFYEKCGFRNTAAGLINLKQEDLN